MIFFSPQQLSELRKVPTTKVTHVIVEESFTTPLAIKVSEFFSDGHREYEITQEGIRSGT